MNGHITVQYYGELFRWNSFEVWCNHAKRDFRSHGVRGENCICVDQLGYICTRGKQFMEAKERNSFPVVCYLIDPP